ncbi:HNH endonuclease signature motif containing protein [Nocardioides lacusdianchii]|uniref:HNH endonuclease signature motif containing protein n=1 Tax=Nocardioides lacusdianchii TaxID=2783664 RepID=UPI001CCC612F|nr:HNH endonuclease signature motif containing protein [Nocardioides lacusdianchii]
MIETLEAGPEAGADALSPAALLASIRSRKAAEDQAAADVLELAARWADLHPPESIHSAASFTVAGCEHEEPIAGPGTPLVAEFCVAELGTVLGITSVSAKKLIGHALELRHRLPRLWAQVHAGRVPAWRARAVAEATIHSTPALTREAARFVDAQVAAVAGRIGPAQLDRLVAETIKRYDLATVDPAADPEDGYLHVDPRHVTIHDQDVHFAGTVRLEAEVDLADGLDIHQALAYRAATLKALGSELPLDARRAKALGDLARTQTALDLHDSAAGRAAGGSAGDRAAGGSAGGRVAGGSVGGRVAGEERAGVSRPDLPAARQVVLHAHFDATTAGDTTIFSPTGRLEEGQRLVLLDQLKSWCGDSRTKVTVKPVIDLNEPKSAPGYEIPDRIREHVILRDRTCVFPWCARPARGCDVDHVTEFDHDAEADGRPQPGPTETENLGALCRFHHRLKTHSAWRYDMVAPGVFEWTSPHGHRYRRDRTGTTALDPPDPGRPRVPSPRR